MPSLVVKVGGSIYDLPDLATRLGRWLDTLAVADVLLIPGGGAMANAIRAFDKSHQLGEDKSHWLALRALTLNAYLLADLLPGSSVVSSLEACTASHEGPAILDSLAFARWDEGVNPDECLPHDWSATSDSLAARVAIVAEARRLILLKSTTIPEGLDWTEAGRQGFVDPLFATVLQGAQRPLEVCVVNLRTWPE